MRLGVVFAGQGAQHAGMGTELRRRSPAAEALYQEADRILGWSVSRLCAEGTMEELTACAKCQPAIYVTSLAGRASLRETPQAEEQVVGAAGLSLGELSALTAAGVLAFEDGLRAVAKRGELMDAVCRREKGAMAAVLGMEDEALRGIAEANGVDVANYNCPGQRIVSGAAAAVAAASAAAAARGAKVVPLEVAGAYHSRLMREAGEAFRAYLEEVPLQAPSFPVWQNVSGAEAPSDAARLRDNLAAQIYSPVLWEDCCRALLARCDSLREIGPGHVLTGLVKRIQRGFPAEAMDL